MQTPVQEAIGNAQQLFADQARSTREELIETGQCEPYTIVNFNPVGLRLEGELQRYSVPSPHDGRLPKNVLRVRLPYDGRERIGHLLTIRDPHIFGKNVSAVWHPGGGPGDAVVTRQVMYYTPLAIAFNFLEHFSPIFVLGNDGKSAPPPKDARKIYGVLAFRGDIHMLEKLLLETDPVKRRIHVPLATMRTVGKLSARTYKSVETSLDDYLARMFDGQLRYADAVVSRAQQKHNGTDEDRKDISASDRIWYRWAIDMGYAQPPKPGERTWLNELLTLTPAAVAGDTPAPTLRKCQACRTPEPEPGTPFCPKCNAPINTFDTFMAGYPVSEAWLMALRGEEREIALEEMKLRKQGFNEPADREPNKMPAGVSSAGGPTDGPKKPGRGSYKQPRGATTTAAVDDIPAADTTDLPGE